MQFEMSIQNEQDAGDTGFLKIIINVETYCFYDQFFETTYRTLDRETERQRDR
jgi:hypothetical protein